MNEPTLQIMPDQLFAILGQKEVERLLLINRVQQLEAKVKELSPKEPNLEVVK